MSFDYIDKETMEKICHRIAVDYFDRDEEPIAPFDHHTNELLESALNLPRATFGQQELYPSLKEKASVLYYSLIKNHPFENGNKRIATATLLVFLAFNDRWLKDQADELTQKAIWVAKSSP
ncbi:MAG: Death-on-curing family protein, partial [Candidatus Giovannonibacteria bacterium GW2011_GWA2_53_7]